MNGRILFLVHLRKPGNWEVKQIYQDWRGSDRQSQGRRHMHGRRKKVSSKERRKLRRAGVGEFVILNRMHKEGLTEKIKTEKIPERGKGKSKYPW